MCKVFTTWIHVIRVCIYLYIHHLFEIYNLLNLKSTSNIYLQTNQRHESQHISASARSWPPTISCLSSQWNWPRSWRKEWMRKACPAGRVLGILTVAEVRWSCTRLPWDWSCCLYLPLIIYVWGCLRLVGWVCPNYMFVGKAKGIPGAKWAVRQVHFCNQF